MKRTKNSLLQIHITRRYGFKVEINIVWHKLINMKLLIYIIPIAVLFSCNARHYSGYVYDSDNNQPLDSVLVTDNHKALLEWVDFGILPAGEYLHAITDSSGFFSFQGKDRKDFVEIVLAGKGYRNIERTHTFFDGDTLYLDPVNEILEARKQELMREEITVRHFPMKSGDTVFIVNEEKTRAFVHFPDREPSIQRNKIYIDPDKNSNDYNYVINFRLSDRYYHRVPASPKREISPSLPRKWVQLDEYKGNYYLYNSAKTALRFEITDTMLISFGWMEGNFGLTYDSIIQEMPDQYRIKNLQGVGYLLFNEICIYIIDNEKGIAIFEMYQEGERWYKLFVDEAKARNFPIISHFYEGNHILIPTYYPLDDTDFGKLLEQFKRERKNLINK